MISTISLRGEDGFCLRAAECCQELLTYYPGINQSLKWVYTLIVEGLIYLRESASGMRARVTLICAWVDLVLEAAAVGKGCLVVWDGDENWLWNIGF